MQHCVVMGQTLITLTLYKVGKQHTDSCILEEPEDDKLNLALTLGYVFERVYNYTCGKRGKCWSPVSRGT